MACPETLTASGAGESAANGDYTKAQDGEIGAGDLTWAHDTSANVFIYDDQTRYLLVDQTAGTGENEVVWYQSDAHGDTSCPHELDWNVVDGTAPAPTVSGGDATAPSLSNASCSVTGSSTLDGSVTTDEGNGTLYWVVTQSSSAPSAAQVKAGQDHTGSAADDSGNQAVSSTGSQSISASGLSPETEYFIHYMHEDDAANQSSVASSSGCTTNPSALTRLSNRRRFGTRRFGLGARRRARRLRTSV